MGKLVKLPGGVIFNPETGELSGLSTDRRTTTTSTGGRNHYPRRNYNFSVSSIGDWIGEHSESITNYCVMGLYVLSWIGFGIAVITTWINEGFWWALIGGVIGGTIFYYVSTFALGIFIVIMNFLLPAVRYIFYNTYSLLATLAVVGMILLYQNWDSLTSINFSNKQQDAVIEMAVPDDRVPQLKTEIETTLNYLKSLKSINASEIDKIESKIKEFSKLTSNSQEAKDYQKRINSERTRLVNKMKKK